MILLAFCLKTPAKYCRQQVAQLLGLLSCRQVASRPALSCQQVRLSAPVQEVHRPALSCQQVRLSAPVQEVHRLGQAVRLLNQVVHRLDQAARLLSQVVRLLVLKATLPFRDKQVWHLWASIHRS